MAPNGKYKPEEWKTILSPKEKGDLQKFLAFGLMMPYKFGAETKKGFEWLWKVTDCSEFVETGFRVIGYTVPDGSWKQFEKSYAVKNPDTGCVIFVWNRRMTRICHVGIFYDKNIVIHATGRPFNRVIAESYDRFKKRYGKRVTGVRHLILS